MVKSVHMIDFSDRVSPDVRKYLIPLAPPRTPINSNFGRVKAFVGATQHLAIMKFVTTSSLAFEAFRYVHAPYALMLASAKI